jgi:Ca2+-transporting ATPase
MAGEALRVLGAAYSEQSEGAAKGRVFLGLVGLQDVAREGIGDFIAALHRCGIKTVMITGDQAATASAMAEKLGISGQEPLHVYDASRLAELDALEMAEIAEQTHVFARVSASDKLKIVQPLKAKGKTVAMVGDGVNDAPALRGADVGIAMGKKGTEVAREVASVVLLDDKLESLIPAIELGRATSDAIRKSVTYLLTTNLSETMLMSGALVSGLGQPLNPIQLLWINLVTDVFPALALGLEPPETDVLKRPPRPFNESLLRKKDFRRIGVESAVMTATSLAAYGYGLSRYGFGPQAQSIAFTSLVGSQLLHTLSSRSDNRTIFGGTPLKPNRYIPLSVALGFGLQFLAIGHPGVRNILGVAPLSGRDLLVCAAGAGFNFLFNETTRHLKSTDKGVRDHDSN